MGKTRTRDPELTRSAILDAAEELFIQKGMGHTSLSEIAKKAGVTKSLIHHHFESKQLLWEEMKNRVYDAYTEQQMTLLQESELSLETLIQSIVTYFRFLKANPKIIRLMAWMALEETEHREESCGARQHAGILRHAPYGCCSAHAPARLDVARCAMVRREVPLGAFARGVPV